MMVEYGDGGYGFADLIDPNASFTVFEVYEVKRVTCNARSAFRQILKYTLESWAGPAKDLYYTNVDCCLKTGTMVGQKGAFDASVYYEGLDYIVAYEFTGGGIIVYDYFPNDTSSNTETVTEPALSDKQTRKWKKNANQMLMVGAYAGAGVTMCKGLSAGIPLMINLIRPVSYMY